MAYLVSACWLTLFGGMILLAAFDNFAGFYLLVISVMLYEVISGSNKRKSRASMERE